MKMKFIALTVIAVLPLMAFDCFTDFNSLNVSLNLMPITAGFALNPGTSKTYGGTTQPIDLSAFFDQSYTVTDATIYDIRIQTKGPDLGAGSGAVFINGTQLFTFSGTWSSFATPQSLITDTLIVQSPLGVSALKGAVTGRQRVTLSAAGTVTTPPSTSGDSIFVSIYVQATGHK